MKIRKATKNDILDVLKLVKQITDYHCKIDKLYKPYKEYRRLKEHLEETIENRDRIIIVAEDNNKIIGYFKGGIEDAPNYITPKKIGVIDDAFIKKEYRNKGIGDKLLNQMLKYFRTKKIKYIGLSVDARNVIGVNFWKENDFFEHRIEMRRIL